MEQNTTISAERLHIGFFGRRNAGKSSLVNAITGQALSVVSDVPGTTTDTVQKAMELLPLGPVVILDTPGFDDVGELGAKRVEKTREALRRTNIAVLVVDGTVGMTEVETTLLHLFEDAGIPHITIYTKADLPPISTLPADALRVCAPTGWGIDACKDALTKLVPAHASRRALLDGVVQAGDTVVLVMPIDESAPKGRLILPQQQTIQELLLRGAKAMVCQDTHLSEALAALKDAPTLVITDSQAFGRVSKIVPESVPLTSFSILFMRYKGDLAAAVQGAHRLATLKDGDSVLICEGCTHHRQCGDIGTVKLPAWIRSYCHADPHFTFVSGREFPEDLSPYSLIIHCGGCMLNEQEMKSRMSAAKRQGVPMTNYGTAIAQMNGILARSLAPFEIL